MSLEDGRLPFEGEYYLKLCFQILEGVGSGIRTSICSTGGSFPCCPAWLSGSFSRLGSNSQVQVKVGCGESELFGDALEQGSEVRELSSWPSSARQRKEEA